VSSVPTASLLLEQPTQGDYDDTWAEWIDRQLQLIDQAIAGLLAIVTTGGTINIVATPYQLDEARNSVVNVTGTLSQDANLTFPAQGKEYTILNNTAGSFAVRVKTTASSVPYGVAGTTGIAVPQGMALRVRVGADGSLMAAAPYAFLTTGACISISQDTVG
jgi:hypothetical protein